MINSNSTDTTIVRSLGQAIKQMRLRRNITQDMLAEKAGVDRATIGRMEKGSASTLLTLVQVLRALDQLAVLDAFERENEVSPLQELKRQQKQKERASPTKKTIRKK